jgi:hypothetical protein
MKSEKSGPRIMRFPFRALVFLLLALAGAPLLDARQSGALAQERSAQERAVRDIETKGFRNVTGLRRRGQNYVFQAEDLAGDKVGVVMNAQTGEIVGLTRIIPKKK